MNQRFFLSIFVAGQIRSDRVLRIIRREKLTRESRVLRKKRLSRAGEKSGCSLSQQSYFHFNYTPEARLTSTRRGGEGGKKGE